MKKIYLLATYVLSAFVLTAQIDIPANINPVYQNFLPSNANPNDLRPSDIPSEQILREMGFSDDQIAEAMDFKYSRGRYAEDLQDTTLIESNKVETFYLAFGDTLTKDTSRFPQARIFGQDIFRNNKLSFFQKALDAKAPENYKVGPGDEISISVWGYSQFSETLNVDDRGYINPSSYGRIYVKGLTFKKMRLILKNKFSTFLDMKNSEIDVTLSYSRVITVNIVGEVYNPGSYTIPAINTAFNALVAARGPNQLGTVRNIYIKRNGKTVDSLDVYEFLFDPSRSQDIYLQDGDYLFVPPANNIIEIQGAVNRPYTYEMKSNETVAQAIKYAGGYTTNAFKDLITLKRIDYDSKKVYDINKDNITETNLQNGDEIIVNSISNKLSNVVSIKGDIGVSGDYEYVRGERLLGLLNRAKFISDKTFLERAYIIRLNTDRTKSHITVNLNNIIANPLDKENILLQEYDIVRILSIDDFDDVFSVSVMGAIRKKGVFDFGIGMTLEDVLLQAGGFTQDAEGSRVEVSRIIDYNSKLNKLNPRRTIVKTIKIGDGLILSNDAQSFQLQPFDQVFVRSNPDFEAPQNVVLSGEVKYPGIYTLIEKDERISSLIERAGGLTNYAHIDGIKMFRKFEVTEEEEQVDMSQRLKDSILSNPELAKIYFSEINQQKDEEYKGIFDLDERAYAYDMVYLNLHKALKDKESKHNLVLVEGDSIIIPKTMDVVHITGALMNLEGNSISAPYFNRRRAHYYVNNFAGGYNKENNKANTIVVYPNGIAKKTMNLGLFTISPRVKKGSTIMVKTKTKKETRKKGKPVDWNRQIENAMVKVTAVLTLWLLVERVNAE